jgi:hypothetical protein
MAETVSVAEPVKEEAPEPVEAIVSSAPAAGSTATEEVDKW